MTPLVTVESTGWRFSWGATYTLTSGWIVDAGYDAEFGPGASSRGLEGSVTYTMGDELSLTAHAATLYRPLEFRFDESSLDMIGLAADYRLRSRVRFQIDGSRYAEDRKRRRPRRKRRPKPEAIAARLKTDADGAEAATTGAAGEGA